MPWDRIIILCFLVLLPLVPAVLLYKLFGNLNLSEYQPGLRQGIRLGGPVAAYVVIMLTAYNFFQGIAPTISPLDKKLRKQYEIALSNYERVSGNWYCLARFVDENGMPSVVKARAVLTMDSEDRLRITGEWRDPEDDSVIGHWDAEEIILTDHKLLFFYDSPAVGDNPPYTGLGRLSLVYGDENEAVQEMGGSWGILEQNYYGTMTWTREPSD